MENRDKWIIAILILIMTITGLCFYGFIQKDDTEVSTGTTIVVNGNGSSGTGNVTTTTQVVQQQVVTTSGGTKAPTTTASVSSNGNNINTGTGSPEG